MPMSSLRVERAVDRADVRAFADYPFARYADDPVWVPPLRAEERKRFDRKSHPFFEYGSMDLYLARREGDLVGRVAVIDNPRHRACHDTNVDFFGFFEVEDAGAAKALLERAESTAASRGRDAIWGPVNPSLNESAGVQVSGFEKAPFVLMPHNPPNYQAFLEDAGYEKVKDLFAWSLFLEPEPPARIRAIADWVRSRRAVTIRTPNMRRLREEVDLIVKLYDQCWQENWGFVSPTTAEIWQITRDLRSILDNEIAIFAEVQGETAGFAIGLPDYNVLLKALGGRITPVGLVRSLWAKRHLHRGRMTLLGVVPKFRGKGIFALMVDEIYRRGWNRGYREVECSWTLEDNDEVHTSMHEAGATLYKTYRIYGKPLG